MIAAPRSLPSLSRAELIGCARLAYDLGLHVIALRNTSPATDEQKENLARGVEHALRRDLRNGNHAPARVDEWRTA